MKTYFAKALEAFKINLSIIAECIRTGKNLSQMVSISEGNTKTGKIPSVSLLPRFSCPWNRCKDTCGKRCYAIKLCTLRNTVMNAYAKNSAVFKLSPAAYFNAVDSVMKRSQFFRYHIGGDIPNRKYFRMMIKTAKDNPHCTVLFFTKQYEIVNEWIAKNGQLPANMRCMFSGWTNLKPVNPYNLPETTVYAKDEDFNPAWTACGGNCLDCALHCGGCWDAKSGDTVAFKIH